MVFASLHPAVMAQMWYLGESSAHLACGPKMRALECARKDQPPLDHAIRYMQNADPPNDAR